LSKPFAGAKPSDGLQPSTLEKEKQMGKIALTQLTSLDGVMQSPGPTDVPFKYRGWIMDFDFGPEGDRFKLEEAQNAEALLLGRVTYEAMQAFWPTAEGEFADRLNELPKYVVSSTLTDPHWNATVLGDDWPEEVARLRSMHLPWRTGDADSRDQLAGGWHLDAGVDDEAAAPHGCEERESCVDAV
jgi:dihydrofolate reductase